MSLFISFVIVLIHSLTFQNMNFEMYGLQQQQEMVIFAMYDLQQKNRPIPLDQDRSKITGPTACYLRYQIKQIC